MTERDYNWQFYVQPSASAQAKANGIAFDADAASLASQIYKTLPENHIRVLLLLSTSCSDQITCLLEVHDLSNIGSNSTDLEYEAVSYEWGTAPHPGTTHRILLNEVSYPVYDNLWYALKDFRGRDVFKRLWIDALCINQYDDEERGWQVRMMAEIYRLPRRVLVRLGGRENMRIVGRPSDTEESGDEEICDEEGEGERIKIAEPWRWLETREVEILIKAVDAMNVEAGEPSGYFPRSHTQVVNENWESKPSKLGKKARSRLWGSEAEEIYVKKR